MAHRRPIEMEASFPWAQFGGIELMRIRCFLSHSCHPFIDGIVREINDPAIGIPPFVEASN